MINDSEVEAAREQLLSALADGEIEPSGVAKACEHWRDDPSARQRWHDYQLIGDVMRSDDLAATPSHDESFLLALRSRLADEPVVLAPTRRLDEQAAAMSGARPSGRHRIATFGAIAAGFMLVVAGALTMTGLPSMLDSTSQPTAGTLAQSQSQPQPATLVSAGDIATDPVNELQPTIVSGKLIRDARLDRYFSAHQQWSSDAMMAGHAAFMTQSISDGAKR